MTEKNIFQADKLEELLIKNWTQFLDSSRLMAFCLQNVRDNQHTFDISKETLTFTSNIQITLSRFQIKGKSFILWLDFQIPMNSGSDLKIARGTSEIILTMDGEILPLRTIGRLYNI